MDLRSANNKNYYSLLGLTKEASAQEIRSHYLELARVYHPDSNFYSDITSERVSSEQIELFKIITNAYHTLIDPQKRQEYDEEVMPLAELKIRVWEDPDDIFSAKPDSSDPAITQYRKRAGTFGQTGVQPLDALTREEIIRAAQAETSIKEALEIKSRGKTRKMIFASIGMLIGVACLFMLILNFDFSAITYQGGQKNVESYNPNSPKAPPAFRGMLDG